jgi:preprotein translocase subunit SecF
LSSLQKTAGNVYLFKISNLEPDRKAIVEPFLEKNLDNQLEELRYENVGPSIGPDLIKKTFYAMIISAVLILFWVAIQFKSFKFGVSAVLAMFHDSLVLIGSFALLGHFFGAEVDFLFVTAALTILSFSVHDTIVVYDRIRESQKKVGGSLYDLANKAVTETMVRSLNNSFTIIFMLAALLLLGGETIKWFAAALLIGTVSGTYSSPFVAVPLLVTWDELRKKYRR